MAALMTPSHAAANIEIVWGGENRDIPRRGKPLKYHFRSLANRDMAACGIYYPARPMRDPQSYDERSISDLRANQICRKCLGAMQAVDEEEQ